MIDYVVPVSEIKKCLNDYAFRVGFTMGELHQKLSESSDSSSVAKLVASYQAKQKQMIDALCESLLREQEIKHDRK